MSFFSIFGKTLFPPHLKVHRYRCGLRKWFVLSLTTITAVLWVLFWLNVWIHFKTVIFIKSCCRDKFTAYSIWSSPFMVTGQPNVTKGRELAGWLAGSTHLHTRHYCLFFLLFRSRRHEKHLSVLLPLIIRNYYVGQTFSGTSRRRSLPSPAHSSPRRSPITHTYYVYILMFSSFFFISHLLRGLLRHLLR